MYAPAVLYSLTATTVHTLSIRKIAGVVPLVSRNVPNMQSAFISVQISAVWAVLFIPKKRAIYIVG